MFSVCAFCAGACLGAAAVLYGVYVWLGWQDRQDARRRDRRRRLNDFYVAQQTKGDS